MHFVILALALIVLVVGPGLWVKAVMRRYHSPRDRYGRTGAELAQELLDGVGLAHVKVEPTESGDHYDPRARAVRLAAENFGGRSLTALTVAAHEVGHAIQDARGFRPLRWRTRFVAWAGPIEKTGAGLMMAAPFVGALTRAPAIGFLALAGGVLALGTGVLVHALTLPTELDASFRRALPLLEQRRILREEDLPGARRLLTAAAFTYVSVALQSLLNIARWWAILRR